jgi:hypothetical protein
MTAYIPLLGAVNRVPQVAYLDSADSTSSLTTYTFTLSTLGVDVPDRYIVIGFFGRASTSARSLSSLTVGGSSTTSVVSTSTTSGGFNTTVGLRIVSLPTVPGNNDVVVTWSAGMIRSGVVAWRLAGLQSSTAVATDTTINTDPAAMTLASLLVGDAALAMVYDHDTGNVAWTGLTEDADQTYISGASGIVAADGSLNVSANITGSLYSGSAAAAWR